MAHLHYSDIADLTQLEEPELTPTKQMLEQIESTPEGQELFQRMKVKQELAKQGPVAFFSDTKCGASENMIGLNDEQIRDTLIIPTGMDGTKLMHLTYLDVLFHEMEHYSRSNDQIELLREADFKRWHESLTEEQRAMIAPLVSSKSEFVGIGNASFLMTYRMEEFRKELVEELAADPEGKAKLKAEAFDSLLNAADNNSEEMRAIHNTSVFLHRYRGQPYRQGHSGFPIPAAYRPEVFTYVNSDDIAPTDIALVALDDARLGTVVEQLKNASVFDLDKNGNVTTVDLDSNSNDVFDYEDYEKLVALGKSIGALDKDATPDQYIDNDALMTSVNKVITAIKDKESSPKR